MKSILLFSLLILSISCSKSSYEKKDTLVVAIDSAPKTLDPRYATDAYGQRMNSLLFQSLVRISENLSVEPEAAEKWTYKNLKYQFFIPRNIYFSNGDPLTKEDLLFTFEEYKKPDCPFRGGLEQIHKLYIDETDIHFIINIQLKEYRATFLTDLVPIKILQKKTVTKWGKDFSFHLVGSGPYFLEIEDINQFQFKRNFFYPNNPAKSENIYFKVIQDESTRYLKMKKGELDIAPSVITPSRVAHFKNKKDFTVYIQPGLSMNYMLLNTKSPLLKDLRVRKAIAKAINIPEIIEYKLEGYASQATSILSPKNYFHNQKLKPIPFSLEEAKKIFPKKYLQHQISLKTSNSVEAIENAKIIAYQLKNLGIEVKQQSFEWGTFYGDIKSGNYEIALMRWIGATDPDIYRVALHSKETPPGRNRGYYSNKNVDKLLDKGLKISNLEKRKVNYDLVQKIVFEELPYIPLWYNQQITVINNRVKNYTPRSNGDFLGLIQASK